MQNRHECFNGSYLKVETYNSHILLLALWLGLGLHGSGTVPDIWARSRACQTCLRFGQPFRPSFRQISCWQGLRAHWVLGSPFGVIISAKTYRMSAFPHASKVHIWTWIYAFFIFYILLLQTCPYILSCSTFSVGLSWRIKVTHVECTTGQELKIIITVLIDNFILRSFIVFSVQIYQLMDSLIRSEKNETPFLVWSMGSKMSFFCIFMIFFFP